MRRMKLCIASFFVLNFLVFIVINGLYNVISMKSNFLTFKAMFQGFYESLFYLSLVWMTSRKHPRATAMLLVIGIWIIVTSLLAILLFGSVDILFDGNGPTWDDILLGLWLLISSFVAGVHGAIIRNS